MKFWNKDKDTRRTHWTRVSPGRRWIDDAEAKRWCQQQTSSGKFYKYYGTDTWWFEHEQDATMFMLKWA